MVFIKAAGIISLMYTFCFWFGWVVCMIVECIISGKKIPKIVFVVFGAGPILMVACFFLISLLTT